MIHRLFSLLLLLGASLLWGAEQPLTLYSNGRFELYPLGSSATLSPDSLCAALQSHNPQLGKPRCAVAGSLQRDTLFSRYANWVNINLLPNVDPEDLTARHPEVKRSLEKRRDDYLLMVRSDSSGGWVALYHNGHPYPIRLLPFRSEKQALSRILSLFKGQAIPIPTEKEREAARIEPDQFFRDELPLDWFFAVGGGAMRGIWGHRSARVEEYTQNSDSASAWDWLKAKSPTVSMEYGVSYARFAAIAGYLQWSHHDVKFNSRTNPAIDNWSLLRWEFGLRTRMGYTFFPLKSLELHPYLGLAFHFTVYQEMIDWKQGVKQPDDYFHLVALTGASVGTGLQILWDGRWGVRAEGGLARRSRRPRDIEPGGSRPPDRPGEESYELYLSGAIIRNFRSWL